MAGLRHRDLFVSAPKRLEIGFYTSSIDKFLQARLVFEKAGLILRHFKSSQEPYHEAYDLGQEQLLERAIKEIKRRLGVSSLFFVEDTSVRISALSSENRVVPGLEVKEWFARTIFAELDASLRQRGNDRTATVYSDIALHVPGLNRLVFIHGETKGHVAETAPDFSKSAQHPWLTPSTFNGWFVPDGATSRLGEMSFEESLEYDFRVRSLTSLIDRLEEYAAALNLGAHSYSVKRTAKIAAQPILNLFNGVKKAVSSPYVVVGKLCAGKTTLGEYAVLKHSFRFIEASSIMRMLANENEITAPNAYYQAKELLQENGPDIIARHIVGTYGEELRNGAVITGFRTIEEVQYMRSEFGDCKVVYIDASERTRFERHLHRGRQENIETMSAFLDHDQQQWRFGLLLIAQDIADIKIENEGTMEEFHAQIDALLEGNYESTPGISEIKHRAKIVKDTRIFRCLRALEQIREPATSAEIAKLTERDTPSGNAEHVERISPRHVNWLLKDLPELVRRVDAKGKKIHYQILPSGQAYLKAIRSMIEWTSD